MRRLTALVLLAAICGQATADITMLIDPTGKPAVAGKYRLLTIPADATKTPVSTVIDVGGTDVPVPPPPPPPPPVDDVATKISGYLAAANDPDKAKMQTKLAAGYKATIAFADAGTITDAAALKTIQQMVDKQLVSKVADAWKPWTDGMTALVATMDLPSTIATYKIAQAQLGGGPVPPPPPPPPPPQPGNWSVTGGLHVMIVDDENLRGKLPQSQINIFTSSVLRQWLDKACPKAADGRPAYRLASNDSLVEGGEARKQELPVYVQGWDLLMKSGVALPAWIVANGQQTAIEPLPASVDAAIARLEALK